MVVRLDKGTVTVTERPIPPMPDELAALLAAER
jgi:hypothetical protein